MKTQKTFFWAKIGGAASAILFCLAATGLTAALPAAAEGFATPLFTDASSCKKCHDGLTDADGEDVSFVHSWETTMMRFSFLDPFWRAKVRSETIRNPGLADAIEKKCARCHAPMASELAIQNGDEVSLFDGGFVDLDNPYHEAAMEGVGCTLCHQVTSDFLTIEDPFSGNFHISDQSVAWGPFAPGFAKTMERQSGYLPVQASHLGNQVQVYEAIMANVEGEVTRTLLRASHFLKDNRLLPKGFNKTNANLKIRPVGSAMEDKDFKGGEDRITYRIEIENVTGSMVFVEAELKDQTLAYPMVEDLFLDSPNDPDGPIPFFQAEYEHHRTAFEIIDSDTQTIYRQ